MTVHVDLIVLPDGGYMAKAPGYAAWCYKPTDVHADAETVRRGAEQSLKRHISRNMVFRWWGYEG